MNEPMRTAAEPVVDSELRDRIAEAGITKFREYTGTSVGQNMWNLDVEQAFRLVAEAQAAVVAPVLAALRAELDALVTQQANHDCEANCTLDREEASIPELLSRVRGEFDRFIKSSAVMAKMTCGHHLVGGRCIRHGAQLPASPATPAEPRPTRPVYADPGDVEYEYDEDGKPQDPAVRWPIAWGCTVSIGQYDGDLHYTVCISDDVQRDGIAVRSVTRQQIRAYAHHLIKLTGVVGDQPGGGQ